MAYGGDFVNIILPVLSHWLLWLVFLIVVALILIIYLYPIKKQNKEIHKYNSAIPITAIIALYVFAKMLEGVIYKESILKVDLWFNSIVFSSVLNKVALFITNFGGATIIIILFAFVLAILLYKKRWSYAILSTVALLGAVILKWGIKNIVQRVRPANLIETDFSFPSGHAITAIVFVALLIYSFKDDFKNKITRNVLIVVFSLFFIAVGVSRIIIHVHWFSDVIAGMSLGLFWFMLLVLIEKAIPGVVSAVKK
jgi:membrane-associated phospholipid phosphatase